MFCTNVTQLNSFLVYWRMVVSSVLPMLTLIQSQMNPNINSGIRLMLMSNHDT